MEIDYKAVGERVRAERERQRITQDKLAEQTGLSVTHISHIETGKTKLSLPALINLVNALGNTPNDLLCDSVAATDIKDVYHREIAEETADCDEEEIRIVADMIKALKQSLRRRRRDKE